MNDILAGAALLDLTPEEQQILRSADPADQVGYDRTAALIAAAMATDDDNDEPMPAGLRERILSSVVEEKNSLKLAPAPEPQTQGRTPRKAPWHASLGWLAAAAAVLVALTYIQFQSVKNATPAINEQLASLRQSPGA